jgi:putative flippase GtrA
VTGLVDDGTRPGYGRGVPHLSRQVLWFVVAGSAATVAHYGALILLVEGGFAGPAAGALAGYCCGGAVSYVLNRRLAFRSGRRHREALWRFAVVAGVGFGLTGLAMAGFTSRLGWPYLPAQIVTTGLVMMWSFTAHRLWTFGAGTGRPV